MEKNNIQKEWEKEERYKKKDDEPQLEDGRKAAGVCEAAESIDGLTL